MNKEALIKRFNQEQRMELEVTGFRREVAGPVIRHVSLTDDHGFIVYSELSEENADQVIQTEIKYFQQIGQRFEWKLYDYDQPADMLERLKKHGFEIGEPEALLVMQLHSEHPLLTYSLPDNLRLITDEAGIDDLIAVEDEIWQESHAALGARLKQDLIQDPEHIRIYGIYENGRAVSGAWMYLHEGTSFGSLWGGSTLPHARGKGYYTALIAARAQEAWRNGYKYLTVDASPMSRPILEKKGFELLGFSYPCMSPLK